MFQITESCLVSDKYCSEGWRCERKGISASLEPPLVTPLQTISLDVSTKTVAPFEHHFTQLFYSTLSLFLIFYSRLPVIYCIKCVLLH